MAARASVIPKKPTQKTEPVYTPIEERIRLRAYELYLQRGGEDGSDVDDWLQAEAEMAVELEQEAKNRGVSGSVAKTS